MRNQLPYSVECKSSYPFFERIAAFDIAHAARAYADECATTNPQFEYRVMYRGKVHQDYPKRVSA